MESGQKTASYEGTQLLRGSGSALTAMGTWPASIRGEVRRALPLLNRLDPLHSAAVAAQGHQGTCLGIKSSTVLVVSASVPAARRQRQRGDLMAVSSAGKQGGAVGGQLRLGRHPAACLTSTAYRLPCHGRPVEVTRSGHRRCLRKSGDHRRLAVAYLLDALLVGPVSPTF